jgi:hypothetical protein
MTGTMPGASNRTAPRRRRAEIGHDARWKIGPKAWGQNETRRGVGKQSNPNVERVRANGLGVPGLIRNRKMQKAQPGIAWLVGEDFVQAVFVGVDVDHPAEDRGPEAAAGSFTGLLGGDGAAQAELGPIDSCAVIARGHA